MSSLRRRLDLLGVAGCLAIGAAVTALSLFAGIGQYGLGMAFLLAPLLYLAFRRRISATAQPFHTLGLPSVLVGTVAFLGALLGAIYVGTAEPYSRPPHHFDLITLAFATVLVDVLAAERHRFAALVGLAKIVLASVAFRAIRFFDYATFPGNDVYFHADLAYAIVEAGSIPGVETVPFPKYTVTSLFHNTVAAVQLLLGLDTVHSLFVAVVVPFAVVTVLAAYAIVVRHTGSPQPALLAALFVAVGDMFLVRGLTSITPSAFVVLFTCLLLLLLLVRLERSQHLAVFVVLLAAFLTHQLSTFAMAVILGTLFVGTRLYRLLGGFRYRRPLDSTLLPRRHPVTAAYLLFAGVTMVFIWMHIPTGSGGQSFFDQAALRAAEAGSRLLGNAESGEEAAYVGAFESYGFLSNLLYSLGYSFLLLLGAFGALVWLRDDQQSPTRFAYVLVALALLTMIYPMTYVGLDLLFIPHRLVVFLELFLAIFAGVAAWRLYCATDVRAVHALVGVLVVALVFFMLTTPYVNRNDPVYNQDRVVRTELTHAEVDGMLWAANHSNFVYADPVMSNRKLNLTAREAGVRNPTPLQVYPGDLSFADPPVEPAPSESAVVFVRDYALNHTLTYSTTYGSGTVNRIHGDQLRNATVRLSRVYDNGQTANYYVEAE